jgi:hypothetical protein
MAWPVAILLISTKRKAFRELLYGCNKRKYCSSSKSQWNGSTFCSYVLIVIASIEWKNLCDLNIPCERYRTPSLLEVLLNRFFMSVLVLVTVSYKMHTPNQKNELLFVFLSMQLPKFLAAFDVCWHELLSHWHSTSRVQWPSRTPKAIPPY